MKIFFTILLVMFLSTSAEAHAVDEGTITWADGKGNFEVKTERHGTMVVLASDELLGKKNRRFISKRWPHLYKDLMPGDYISFHWRGNSKTGQPIAEDVGVKKRQG